AVVVAVRIVPVARGDDEVVPVRVLRQQVGDAAGHGRTAIDAQRTALGEVVLDVDDEESTAGGHSAASAVVSSGIRSTGKCRARRSVIAARKRATSSGSASAVAASWPTYAKCRGVAAVR